MKKSLASLLPKYIILYRELRVKIGSKSSIFKIVYYIIPNY